MGCRYRFFRHVLCLIAGILLAFTPLIAAHAFSSEPVESLKTDFLQRDTLFVRAQEAFQLGQYEQAKSLWEAAYTEFERNGGLSDRISTLNALCITYQKLGDLDKAREASEGSLGLLSAIEHSSSSGLLLHAQTLNAQASLLLTIGKPDEAYSVWQQVEQFYQQADDEQGKLGSRINQVQALQAMGLYRQAYLQLTGMQEQVESLPNSVLKITGLKSLGDVFQITGNLKEAQALLRQSIQLAERLSAQADTSAAWMSLGNAYRGSGAYADAIQAYYSASQTAVSEISQVVALLNEFSLLVQTRHWETVKQRLPIIESLISRIEPSRASIHAKVNFAVSLQSILEENSNLESFSVSATSVKNIAELLSAAVQSAREINDLRAESYALGQLGSLYEQSGQFDFALALTEQALAISQSANAKDVAYRWQWQKGRLLRRKSTLEVGAKADELVKLAIAAYEEATKTLEPIRSDLIAADSLVQFSFRDVVEPVYREFVDLLAAEDAVEADLQMALQIIEDLQLAELQNFFRSACLDIEAQQIDQIDPTAAIIYPVVLPKRLLVITSIPGVPLQQYSIAISDSDIAQTVNEMLQAFNPAFADNERLKVSQTIYEWLVSPLKEVFQTHHMKTLVFVLDGALRNVPVSALYSGDKYLIEEFSVALAPGLQLISPEVLSEDNLNVLIGGVTEAHKGFPALPGVASEVAEITSILPSRVFLNEDFTTDNLKFEVNGADFPILHLATHGQFSSDLVETFLLGWEEPLQIQDFQVLIRERLPQIRQPIELLVLSACQTAEGDDRAALGLAGFAVRSGARSTIATLWSVNDQSTALLISDFYKQFVQNRNISKADALRKAQIKLLKTPEYNHPFYWSPFVLVGNWL